MCACVGGCVHACLHVFECVWMCSWVYFCAGGWTHVCCVTPMSACIVLSLTPGCEYLQDVQINHIEMHPSGRRLLVHCRDNVLRMFDLRV